MKCENCGADVVDGARRCEYCDSTVVREERSPIANVPAAGSVTEQSNDRRADVFEAVKRSSAYAQRDSSVRHEKLPGGSGLVMLAPIIFFAVFICVSLVIASGAIGMAGMASSHFGAVGVVPAVMSLVPIGFVALGIFMIIRSFTKYQEYRDSPVCGRAAIITSKRTAVSGGSGDRSASTSYFVTAEYEDGKRHEYAIIDHSLFGRLAEDDAGVLYTRSNYALDFDRVLSL
ncbi:MAG: DUF2500 family protein [Pirellulales bacterium]|nr:DUF2500 family protein [Pirellulales bacterium]